MAMHPAFSLEQHAIIAQWSAERPLGLRIELALGHDDYLEMAHVIPHRALDSVYEIFATDDGNVVLADADGGSESFGITDALARVLELEHSLV